MPLSYFKKLQIDNPDTYDKMMEDLSVLGLDRTSRKYAHLLEDDPTRFYLRLRMHMQRMKKNEDIKIVKKSQMTDTTPNAEIKLTEEEEAFLEKFRSGEIDFEQVQREVAYRVLRLIMKNPMLVKTSDWLKSEMVKIKREEIAVKKGYLETAWIKIFGGFMPPKECPKCGANLTPERHKLEFEEAEILDDSPTPRPLDTPTGF